MIIMWIYENYSEEEYKCAKKRVEEIAVELGAKFFCTRKQKFTIYTGENEVIDVLEINIYEYNDEYFANDFRRFFA